MLRLGHEDTQHAHTFPYEIWSRLHNLITNDSFERLGSDVSREYIFAIQGCYYLLEEATRDEKRVRLWDRRMFGERHTCLLDVAMHRKDQKMIDMLKKHGAAEQSNFEGDRPHKRMRTSR
jgi:hypothetical protein